MGDIVADFSTDLDHLDDISLSGLGATSFIARSAFTNTAGQMRFSVSAGSTTIEIDSDGDGLANNRVFVTDGQFELVETAPGSLVLQPRLIQGTPGDDPGLEGTEEFDDFIAGLGGKDIMAGLTGSDTLYGGDGNDTLFGNDPTHASADHEFLYGEAGDDLLRGGNSDDLFDGGDGTDRVSYFGAAGAVTVSLALQGVAQNTVGGGIDTLISIENLSGSIHNDTFTGDGNANLLWGNDGADTLNGGGGNDTLAGDGAVPFDDIMNGGAGTDTVTYRPLFETRTSGVTVDLGAGTGGQTGGTEHDTLISIENVEGTDFADTITGDGAANGLYGFGGNDTLAGGGGADTLSGGDGDDVLNIGTVAAGSVFDGGNGIDTLRVNGGVATTGPYGNVLVSQAFLASIQSIERLQFAGPNGVTQQISFLLSQVGGSGLSTNLIVEGDANANLVVFAVTTPGSYTMPTLQRVNWTAPSLQTPQLNDQVLLFAAGAGNYVFNGGADADWLETAGGNDDLFGNGGSDTLVGHAGIDRYFGGGGDDLLSVGERSAGYTEDYSLETYDGGTGTDWLAIQGAVAFNGVLQNMEGLLFAGGDVNSFDADVSVAQSLGATAWIVSLADNDVALRLTSSTAFNLDMSQWQFTGWQASSGLIDFSAADGDLLEVTGSAADDRIVGTSTSDLLRGGGGNDELIGGDGDDRLAGGAGNDIMNGGAGLDTITYRADGRSAGVTIRLYAFTGGTTGGTETDTLLSIENIGGTDFSDDIIADGSANEIYGFGGDDVIMGLGGSDTLHGGDGNDTLYGYLATQASTASVFLHGDAGNDTLRGGSGSDYFDGGSGTDRVSYYGVAAGVTVNLGIQGTAQDTIGGGVDLLVGIEDLSGSLFDDTLIGDDNANLISGNSGSDTLMGNGGDDILLPDGSTIDNDTVNGGAGIDAVSYHPAFDSRTSGVTIDLAAGTAGQTGGTEIDTLISIENAGGSDFADIINGSDGVNGVSGWGGDDQISGRGGSDTLDGGDGNDTLFGHTAFEASTVAETLLGGAGDDILRAGSGNDVFNGGTGTDRVSYFGLAGGVTVSLAIQGVAQNTGAGGSDTLISIEYLSGTVHSDTLTGDGNANLLSGNDGSDHLIGGGGDDILFGDGLNLANDILDGGDGIDIVSYQPAFDARDAGVTVDLAAGTAGKTGGTEVDILISIERVGGSDFGDVIAGDGGANGFSGFGGDDFLFGRGGADIMEGGEGNDFLEGGDGDDRLDGGAGIDAASYASAAGPVTVALGIQGIPQATGGAGSDTLIAVENLVGSSFADTLLGDGAANIIAGGAGGDTSFGAGGTDTILGGAGGDLLVGEDGDDALFGEADNDVLSGWDGADWMEGGDGNDQLYGGAGNDRVDGGAGSDLLDGGAGIDVAIGGLGDDFYLVDEAFDGVFENAGEGNDVVFSTVTFTIRPNVETLSLTATTAAIDAWGDGAANVLIGNVAANLMVGLGGDDWIEANGGADWLIGGDGIDRLDGGGGNDVIEGGLGTDLLIGGGGADIFRFNGAADSNVTTGFDYIFGFETGIDKVVAVRQSAADTFSLQQSGADTVLWIDYGGDGSNDLAAIFLGTPNITSADIILA